MLKRLLLQFSLAHQNYGNFIGANSFILSTFHRPVLINIDSCEFCSLNVFMSWLEFWKIHKNIISLLFFYSILTIKTMTSIFNTYIFMLFYHQLESLWHLLWCIRSFKSSLKFTLNTTVFSFYLFLLRQTKCREFFVLSRSVLTLADSERSGAGPGLTSC